MSTHDLLATVTLACLAAPFANAAAPPPPAPAADLAWTRDYKDALAQSRRMGKPIFVRFR